MTRVHPLLRLEETRRDVRKPGGEDLDCFLDQADHFRVTVPVDCVEGFTVVTADARQRIAPEDPAAFPPQGLQGIREGLSAGAVTDKAIVVAEREVVAIDPETFDHRCAVQCSQQWEGFAHGRVDAFRTATAS